VRRLLLLRRRLLQEGKWGVLCWGDEWNEEGRESGEKGEAPRRARLLPFPLLRCVALRGWLPARRPCGAGSLPRLPLPLPPRWWWVWGCGNVLASWGRGAGQCACPPTHSSSPPPPASSSHALRTPLLLARPALVLFVSFCSGAVRPVSILLLLGYHHHWCQVYHLFSL
jgi:hypothetical protein